MLLSKHVLCTGHKQLIQRHRMSPALKQLLPSVSVLNDRPTDRQTDQTFLVKLRQEHEMRQGNVFAAIGL